MKKTLIIYCSSTGFTKQYAEWIKQETDADLAELSAASPALISNYEIIVCGGGLYGGTLNGIKKYRKLRRQFEDKTFIFFALGLRPPEAQILNIIKKNNFPESPWTELYYFEGGLNKEKLEPSQRTLLVCYKAMMKRRGSLSEADALCVDRLRHSGDYSSRGSIQPLVNRLKFT